MRRIRSVLNVLLGLSEDPAHGYRWKVECRPEAWRCSVCGGGLVLVTPPDKPMVHYCGQRCEEHATRVRYIGLRAHAKRVWATTWANRPRLERTKPHGVRAHTPAKRSWSPT